jgi:hypothetical protein
MEHHPLADMFPLLNPNEAAALADDIREHGLREPIVLLDGKILDGRNRHNACIAADIEPRFVEYAGDDPAAYVISVNLKRRHLKESQRAMVAARIANIRQGTRTDLEPSANLPEVSQVRAAEILNVSERSVRSARTVIDQGVAELVAAVDHGEVSVSTAADFARQVEPAQQAALIEQTGCAREAVRRARPEEKVIRQALRNDVTFSRSHYLAGTIFEVAGCLNNEDTETPDDEMKPSSYWRYLSFVGDDLAERAQELDDAIKALQAIRRAIHAERDQSNQCRDDRRDPLLRQNAEATHRPVRKAQPLRLPSSCRYQCLHSRRISAAASLPPNTQKVLPEGAR